jgi:hypothetical protein
MQDTILRLIYRDLENHDRPQLVMPISGPKYEDGDFQNTNRW